MQIGNQGAQQYTNKQAFDEAFEMIEKHEYMNPTVKPDNKLGGTLRTTDIKLPFIIKSFEGAAHCKRVQNQINIITDNLYQEKNNSKDTLGGTKYELSALGKELAGEDGVITKDELLSLDKNNDGLVSQEEINQFKSKSKRDKDIRKLLGNDTKRNGETIYKELRAYLKQ